MADNAENSPLETVSTDKNVENVEAKNEEVSEPTEKVDTGKMSSKSSDISIEEIGPEEEATEKDNEAEVLIPEVVSEPTKDIVKVEPARLESVSDDEDEEDDFEDESLVERLVGLTEMFPKGLTSGVSATTYGSISAVKWLYGGSREAIWVICSSLAITFMPLAIETEKLAMEEQQKMQQRQILLGPGAAMSGKAAVNAPLPTVD